MAPEVMTEQPYNEKVDVFGFGMILWEMVLGEIPYVCLYFFEKN